MRVRAKTGYVVTGMHIHGGGNLEGFDLEYTRIASNGTLDPTDHYHSDWIGIHSNNSRDTNVDTAGGLAVGIFGSRGDKIGDIGLITLHLDPAPPTGTSDTTVADPAQSK